MHKLAQIEYIGLPVLVLLVSAHRSRLLAHGYAVPTSAIPTLY